MWVKICANTSAEDALLAVQHGADAVGFVFAPSKRQVTVEQVAAITPSLPAPMLKIGVFYTTDFDEILRGATVAGLNGVQLHQEYEPELVKNLHEQGFFVIQTMHWDTSLSSDAQLDAFLRVSEQIDAQGLADALLVDSRTPKAIGGTGVSFDWEAASAALRGVKTPLVIAGGLGPENVVDAIAKLSPWGVDVATGVEASPGVKDAAKVREFIDRAKASVAVK